MRTLLVPPPGIRLHADSFWNPLVEGMQSGGLIVAGPEDPAPIDAAVLISRDFRILAQDAVRKIPARRRALIVMEPPVTAPLLYTRATQRVFGRIFTASPHWSAILDGVTFAWPQKIPGRAKLPPNSLLDRPHFATMILANKRSAVRGSMYRLRREFVTEALRGGVDLVVAGPGWSDGPATQLASGGRAAVKALGAGRRPRLREAFGATVPSSPAFMGPIADKTGILSLAPVSVVIENSLDYVSEKLVDAIAGGAVPYYCGPPLSQFGIPEDVVLRMVPSATRAIQRLRSASDSELQSTWEAGQSWLQSREAQAMGREMVLSELGRSISRALVSAG